MVKLLNVFVLLALSTLVMISFVAAIETNIGTKKLDDCIDLIQSCADCTYVNFTSYTMPNGTRVIIEVASVQDGTSFTYNDCNISGQLGTWIIDGHGDLDSVDTIFTYTYDVTTTGNPTPGGMPTFQMGVMIIIFGTACFLLFLSIQMNEVGLKIFFLITSLVFLMATMLTAYMVSSDGNVSAAINSTTLGLITVLGVILFIIFIWIIIRQTVNAMEMLKLKRGHAWDVGSGVQVAGYNTRRAY